MQNQVCKTKVTESTLQNQCYWIKHAKTYLQSQVCKVEYATSYLQSLEVLKSKVQTQICEIKLAKSIRKETGLKNLCLSGGVALNCVANGKLVKEKIFDAIWVQPASGDAGSSLGAALVSWHEGMQKIRLIEAY